VLSIDTTEIAQIAHALASTLWNRAGWVARHASGWSRVAACPHDRNSALPYSS